MNLAQMIRRGGVMNVDANDVFEVYEQICPKMSLPDSVTAAQLYEGLCRREKVMSTAVGHGIALPHCRDVILKDDESQQITVVYLKNPIDMNAPDGKKSFGAFRAFDKQFADAFASAFEFGRAFQK